MKALLIPVDGLPREVDLPGGTRFMHSLKALIGTDCAEIDPAGMTRRQSGTESNDRVLRRSPESAPRGWASPDCTGPAKRCKRDRQG